MSLGGTIEGWKVCPVTYEICPQDQDETVSSNPCGLRLLDSYVPYVRKE